tara:strand:- start:130 stop:1197 length:1068 start_codon:yes stop_codon:yes gene_type:complete
MLNIDDAWESFLSNDYTSDNNKKKEHDDRPLCTDLYISTKTKIAYLNQEIDLHKIFWEIPVIKYHEPKEGILKKQMKVSCLTKEEAININGKMEEARQKNILTMDQIQLIDNPTARKIKFKDIRKINIGLSKKDLITFRVKKKGAFYNCFVLIIRIKEHDIFREIHVKIFNTGKLEIPGIQKDSTLYITLNLLVKYLQPFCPKYLEYKKENISTVLINSNFSCNHFINRQKLAEILKYNYKIHVVFDPCSYPGIQCKFYYNTKNVIHDGICKCKDRCNKKGKGTGENECLEISFMIFRTGSILIVGNCEEPVLNIIYKFLKNMLGKEYLKITQGINIKKIDKKIKKSRKRTLLFK